MVLGILTIIGLGIAINLFGKSILYLPFIAMLFIAISMPSVLAFEHGEFILGLLLLGLPIFAIYWMLKK
jgi:hypothetical protein